MKNFRKIMLGLLLAGSLTAVYAALSPEKAPVEIREIEAPPEIAVEAGEFAGSLHRLARQSSPREFGRHCADPRARGLKLSYQEFRKYHGDGWTVRRVTHNRRDRELYNLLVVNGRNQFGYFDCRRDAGGDWKFVAFLSENSPVH